MCNGASKKWEEEGRPTTVKPLTEQHKHTKATAARSSHLPTAIFFLLELRCNSNNNNNNNKNNNNNNNDEQEEEERFAMYYCITVHEKQCSNDVRQLMSMHTQVRTVEVAGKCARYRRDLSLDWHFRYSTYVAIGILLYSTLAISVRIDTWNN